MQPHNNLRIAFSILGFTLISQVQPSWAQGMQDENYDGQSSGLFEKLHEKGETRKIMTPTEFPYRLVTVRGEDALAEWEKLKSEENGSPVIIGDLEALTLLAEPLEESFYTTEHPMPDVPSILEKAETIKFPDDLDAFHKGQLKIFSDYLEKVQQEQSGNETAKVSYESLEGFFKTIDKSVALDKPPPPPPGGENVTPQSWSGPISELEDREPIIGRWPLFAPRAAKLTVASDILTSKPYEKVYIAIIPTEDWTEIPAYLRWGGWNDNPPSEYHVAALRSWRDRYGAELVGLSHDVMNIRVTTKPKTKPESIALAKEHYDYCYDIVEQGTGDLSTLAATLKAHKWWYFWWD